MGKDGEKPEKQKKTNKIDWKNPEEVRMYRREQEARRQIEKLTGTFDDNYGKVGIATMTVEQRKDYKNRLAREKYANEKSLRENLKNPYNLGTNIKGMTKQELNAYKKGKETQKIYRDIASKLELELNQTPLPNEHPAAVVEEHEEDTDFLFDPEFINHLDQMPDPGPNKGGHKTRRKKRVKKTKRRKQRIMKRKSFKR